MPLFDFYPHPAGGIKPPSPAIQTCDVLYEDDFCQLSEDNLEIKRFSFPVMKSKHLRVDDIRVVWFEGQVDAQEDAKPKTRSWGYSKGKTIYWAADFGRCAGGGNNNNNHIETEEKSNCVVETTDGVRTGFTVRHVDAFLATLRSIAPMSVIIVDNLKID